jgi:predicted TIM-barrel fold metal-dependent hydrolase
MGDENVDTSSPERLSHIIGEFPNLVVIAAHFGGYQMWDRSLKHLVGKAVYFDTSSSLWKLDRDKALEMICCHGVDRILFGTDYPMWDHKEELERLLALGLTGEELEKVLWKNACSLLKIQLV